MKYYGKTGVSTGSCAAAAAKAAALALLAGKRAENVTVKLKTGADVTLSVSDIKMNDKAASCAVTKYAGDDPDVTDGVKIYAEVSRTARGITIDGGEGIGRATKPGLKVPVGRAAINPVPLEMIRAEVMSVFADCGYHGGVKILLTVPGGAEIAKKTLNERLGIIGGLSILGTTGIVEPMSERALIDTIKTEIDVQIASGAEYLLITPGSYGRDFAVSVLGYDIEGAVKCSNFIGETLDYAHSAGVRRVTLIGHAGKLVKLAGGIMNTHSSAADCRMEIIAAHCGMAGASAETITEIMDCATVDAAIEIMRKNNVDETVWRSIGGKIGFHLRERTKGALLVRFIVFSQRYGVLISGDSERGNELEG